MVCVRDVEITVVGGLVVVCLGVFELVTVVNDLLPVVSCADVVFVLEPEVVAAAVVLVGVGDLEETLCVVMVFDVALVVEGRFVLCVVATV